MLEIERLALASASGTTVGTVGVMRVSPAAVDVIPGRVEMDIDARDSDLEARQSVIEALTAKLTDEYTAPDEIDRGVAVLAGTLARLAA